ncbi:GntR family transcriptional regulator [Streptomyces griseorubiginosus]|uniref:GntR family transcriptional regulator n=1 Tax=Streptomyces griseorubiginosus TaxID=67304 RepID=UPI002E819DFB|nr:GntR family transcriptional regulator [Streptomyces griseorubiginosus]WUB43176.1 GntR family transcriptional regulator [Streptomyces griseorubiginosus]WUB51694.1 GntR family transcriptional regulator [Streptomyces griseorubiginosus]
MPDTPTATTHGPISRPTPLRQAVYEALTELIINGSLTPGQHLVEAELAESLGVSRQPIREALQRLQTAGWVDLRPSQGAFVHSPTTEECAQLLSVRALLETHSARGAAQHATPRDVARLWELQQTGLTALAAGDARAIVEANAALHGHITHLSRNAVLAELIPQVDRRVRWYYMPIAKPRGKDAWNEHARIIEAIGEGAPDRAEALMRRHTRNTTDFYCEQLAAVAGRGD